MKKRNVGIELLRLLMAFAVVGCHCGLADRTQAAGFAVPVFMTLAFCFSADRLREGRLSWLGSRMIRLYLPFLVWALFAFVIDRSLLGGPFARDPWGCDATWRSLAIHLIGGTALANNLQMWFIGNLVWLTPVFFIALRPLRGRLPVRALAAVATLAVMSQYSGLNTWLWNRIPVFGLRIPGGRLLEMVPYCCLGLLLVPLRTHSEAWPPSRRLAVSLVSLALYAFLVNFKIFAYCKGFSYAGLHRASQAVLVLAAFHCLPFERLPAWISSAVCRVAKYSLGVYMTHVVLLKLGERYLFARLGIAPASLTEVFVTFAASWLFCFAVSRIPGGRRLVT